MRVLVCGGRDWRDAGAIRRILTQMIPHVVITGGCRGADALAAEIAQDLGLGVKVIEADWEQYGRAAGPIRNQLMIDEGKPDLVIAFPGGRGTADMVSRAKAAGVRVWEPCSALTPGGQHD
jgi:hypothetical protein